MYDFRWIEWNIDHVGKHGVSTEQAEYVVNHERPPYPAEIGDDKLLVWGQDANGNYLQVIYLLDPDGTVFVIHAMPMNDKMKRQYRRRQR